MRARRTVASRSSPPPSSRSFPLLYPAACLTAARLSAAQVARGGGPFRGRRTCRQGRCAKSCPGCTGGGARGGVCRLERDGLGARGGETVSRRMRWLRLRLEMHITSSRGWGRKGRDRWSTDERHPTIFMACAADIAWAGAAGLAATTGLTATTLAVIFLARRVLNCKEGGRGVGFRSCSGTQGGGFAAVKNKVAAQRGSSPSLVSSAQRKRL